MKLFSSYFINMIEKLLIVLLLGCTSAATAQRRLVVADVETLLPIAGANVVSRDGTVITDSLGCFTISDSCQTLSFTHVNYESRIINLEELRDTVYLISKLLNLKEVVVFGHGKQRDYSELKRRLKMNKTEVELAAARPDVAFSIDLPKLINAIIPKRLRPGYRKALRKKRLKENLDNY